MNWNWPAELITAIGTVALATIALVVAFIEGLAMRKHNQLSVKPYLNIEVNNKFGVGISEINFELQNLGVGPAILKRFSIFLDDKEFVMPEAEQEIKAQVRFISSILRLTEFGFFSAIATNERHVLLGMVINGSEIDAKALAERFNFKIEYQSIYENKSFFFDMRESERTKT